MPSRQANDDSDIQLMPMTTRARRRVQHRVGVERALDRDHRGELGAGRGRVRASALRRPTPCSAEIVPPSSSTSWSTASSGARRRRRAEQVDVDVAVAEVAEEDVRAPARPGRRRARAQELAEAGQRDADVELVRQPAAAIASAWPSRSRHRRSREACRRRRRRHRQSGRAQRLGQLRGRVVGRPRTRPARRSARATAPADGDVRGSRDEVEALVEEELGRLSEGRPGPQDAEQRGGVATDANGTSAATRAGSAARGASARA